MNTRLLRKAEALLNIGLASRAEGDQRHARLALRAAARAYRQGGRRDWAAECDDIRREE